eukprot:CAMPEP_0172496224 /NCGR_PEP_ID=MMETSP1066-20121228/83553_1 /TAXON_ID=671091 /ORGANISM="Coscinodiscus wailesii, Strain CCMP2513" /LENGTH=514 /DNA_ID=CAMNT_0013268405 /DNA_START=42 /DNA_END=1586 /DNA_ORIENTATION=+
MFIKMEPYPDNNPSTSSLPTSTNSSLVPKRPYTSTITSTTPLIPMKLSPRKKRRRRDGATHPTPRDQILHNLSDNSSQPSIIGLESQYDAIHSVLRKSLLAPSSAPDQKNVALFLMGRRGHGKRSVLKRVLTSLRDAAAASNDAKPLRVVTLNGLLLRGGDDALAVREILRQLKPPSRSSREVIPAFHSSLTSLSELFSHAKIDSDPLLIVLHELDYFAATEGGLQRGKQVLLYKLFDRASDCGSRLSIVGTMSKMSTSAMLEKRVRSRATGNLVIVDFSHLPFETLCRILVHKFEPLPELQDHVAKMLKEDNEIRIILERNHRLGKDVRWFCRVFSTAVSLSSSNSQLFHSDMILALQCMAGCGPSLRSKSLLSLPTPQLTILLCTRRLLRRQSQRTNNDERTAPPPPLTFRRIAQEYDYLIAKHSTLQYSPTVLYQSFVQLVMAGDLLQVSKDHSGGACDQYRFSEDSLVDDWGREVGVEITLELERELDAMLKSGKLSCPTVLRNWGLLMN